MKYLVIGFDDVDIPVAHQVDPDTEEVLSFDDWTDANRLAVSVNSIDNQARWEAVEVDTNNADEVYYYTNGETRQVA